jgi:hypothetical protein
MDGPLQIAPGPETIAWESWLRSPNSVHGWIVSGRWKRYIKVMKIDLSDEQAAALTKELDGIIDRDRFPFSPRIRTLKGIIGMLRPEPVREPLPAPKQYTPPRVVRARGRRAGR